MLKYSKFIFILIILEIFSCSKDDSPLFSNNILENDAVLRWTGDYAVDGCGFFIIINGHEYKPENESIIDDSFKMNHDIEVKIEYKILDKKIESWCGDLPNPTLTDGIIIITIEKK